MCSLPAARPRQPGKATVWNRQATPIAQADNKLSLANHYPCCNGSAINDYGWHNVSLLIISPPFDDGDFLGG